MVLPTGRRAAEVAPRVAPGVPPALQVREWADGATWDRFVLDASDGTVAHRWAWTQLVPEAYGHRVVPLAAARDGRLVGVLPLVLVRSRLFGRRLVSMPYLDTGGMCTNGDSATDAALLDTALAIAADERVELELRHLTPRETGLPASLHKVTMEVDLVGGADAVWARAKSNRRGQVRKAQRTGLTCAVAGDEGVGDFYRVLAHNMRDLGSPVHRRRFFSAVADHLGEDARFLLVRHGGDTIGAGLLLLHGGRAVLPFSSSLRATLSLAPNQLLYWETARLAVESGCSVLDLGRSSPGSGTYEAKREWGARAVQLYWYGTGRRDDGEDGTGGGDAIAQRLAWAPRVWSRLPVPIATAAGSLVRGGLPQ